MREQGPERETQTQREITGAEREREHREKHRKQGITERNSDRERERGLAWRGERDSWKRHGTDIEIQKQKGGERDSWRRHGTDGETQKQKRGRERE